MTEQKLTKRVGVNTPKYCRDCEEATVHSTGSQLWLSCSFQKGWRSINCTCNLPAKPNKNPEIQGLYPVRNSHQSFWTLKAKIELAVFREERTVTFSRDKNKGDETT